MSKYKEHGAYHYKHYATPGDPYREHVKDVLNHLRMRTDPGSIVADLGAGEGLVVDLASNMLGKENVWGAEIDKHALALAKELGNDVGDFDIREPYLNFLFDVVLILDVLEHVDEWRRVLRHVSHVVEPAETKIKTVLVAVPSTDDRHAVNKSLTFYSDISRYMDELGWHEDYYHERHARHFMIYTSE